MSDELKSLETDQLRELVAALSRSTTSWSLEAAYGDISAIGAELLRRETSKSKNAPRQTPSVRS